MEYASVNSIPPVGVKKSLFADHLVGYCPVCAGKVSSIEPSSSCKRCGARMDWSRAAEDRAINVTGYCADTPLWASSVYQIETYLGCLRTLNNKPFKWSRADAVRLDGNSKFILKYQLYLNGRMASALFFEIKNSSELRRAPDGMMLQGYDLRITTNSVNGGLDNRTTLNISKDKHRVVDDALNKLHETKTEDRKSSGPSACCYFPAPRAHIKITCDVCGKEDELPLFHRADAGRPIIQEYRELAEEFTRIGYPASVVCYCRDCSVKYKIGDFIRSNITFSITLPDRDEPSVSYPSYDLDDIRDYKAALAYLKGADTKRKLMEAMNDEDGKYSYYSYVGMLRKVFAVDTTQACELLRE